MKKPGNIQRPMQTRCASSVKCFTISIALSLSIVNLASASDQYLTFYSGRYTDDKLGHVLVNKPITFERSALAVAALSRVYPFESDKHQWELEGQIGKHYRAQTHWEFNALAIYRWNRFPWDHFLKTTVAIGDGVSLATEVPPLEASSPSNEGARRLMNYILVETTFAPPGASSWSLVARVHHRSGVYGLFGDVRGGSNIIAVGIKMKY